MHLHTSVQAKLHDTGVQATVEATTYILLLHMKGTYHFDFLLGSDRTALAPRTDVAHLHGLSLALITPAPLLPLGRERMKESR